MKKIIGSVLIIIVLLFTFFTIQKVVNIKGKTKKHCFIYTIAGTAKVVGRYIPSGKICYENYAAIMERINKR